MKRTAVIAGYSGLVGRHLLEQILESQAYREVRAVGRKAPPSVGAQTPVWIESTLDDLAGREDELVGDDAFCCLGTTRRTAGSKAGFERVDFHMVVDFARAAHLAGARRFFLVSAVSANPHSPFYYNRVKGRTEQAVEAIGYETVHVLRPSLLIGDRNEHRPGERLAQQLMPLLNPVLVGPFRSMRPVPAAAVAQTMLSLASGDDRQGVWVHHLPSDGT